MENFGLVFALTFVAFALLDAVWIGLVSLPMYNSTIAALLSTPPRILPGIIFYLLNVSGAVIFVALPALRLRNPAHALRSGALFGTVTYGTYSFTNLSVLQDWTWSLALADTAWGAVLTSLATYAAVRAVAKIKPSAVANGEPPAYEAV